MSEFNKVTVTFTDNEDGGVDIVLEAEPTITMSRPTPAQILALTVLQRATAMGEVTLDETESE